MHYILTHLLVTRTTTNCLYLYSNPPHSAVSTFIHYICLQPVFCLHTTFNFTVTLEALCVLSHLIRHSGSSKQIVLTGDIIIRGSVMSHSMKNGYFWQNRTCRPLPDNAGRGNWGHRHTSHACRCPSQRRHGSRQRLSLPLHVDELSLVTARSCVSRWRRNAKVRAFRDSPITMLQCSHLSLFFLVRVVTVAERSSTPVQQTTPAARLPGEILSLIFLYHRWSTTDSTTWLHILHVCRQWRATAIGCSTLWTYIPETRKRSLRLFMLKYSKQSSIILKGLKIVNDLSPETKKILKNNLYRVRELALTFETCNIDVVEWATKVLDPQAAPLLKVLELSLQRSGVFSGSIPVPDAALNIQALVTNCPLEFPADYPQENLNSLRMDLPCYYLINHDINQVTYLCRTLSVMPKLTQLHISNPYTISAYIPYSGPSVSLPYLETLRYTGTTDVCLNILQLLQLPPITRFVFRLHSRGVPLHSLHPLISQALHRRRKANSTTTSAEFHVKFLTKIHQERPMYRVVVFQSAPHLDATLSLPLSQRLANRDSPILFIEFFVSHNYTIPVQRVSNLPQPWLTIFPPQSVESVFMRSEIRSDVGKVVSNAGSLHSDNVLLAEFSFLACPGVKSLYIGDAGTAEWVAPFLGVRPTTTTSGLGNKFFAFPDLETLTIGDFNSSDSLEGFSEDTDTRKVEIDGAMRHIQFAVEERARAGQKLKSLRLPAVVAEALGEWVVQARDMGWVGELVCDEEGYDDLVSMPLDGIDLEEDQYE